MTDGFHTRVGPEMDADVLNDVHEEVESWEAPVLPRAQPKKVKPGYSLSRKLVVLSRPGSLQAESIASLRSHLQANHIRDGRRSLAICAAKGDTGTSFLAANLAASLAMTGASTLLIDANLRDPGLQDYFQSPQTTPSLADYLGQDAIEPDDVIQREVMPNLSLVHAGGAGQDAQRLLAGRRLDTLFDRAMRNFDITIVDTPPSASFGDARRIASALHHAMVVTRCTHSFVSDVKTLVDELKADRVNVVGSFLNQFDDRRD